jgi:enterochelin esterase-like enzyme
MLSVHFLLATVLISVRSSFASTITIHIYYPEAGLNQTVINRGGSAFNLNVYTCQENHIEDSKWTYGQAKCPGGEWFSGLENDLQYKVYDSDKVGANHWVKIFDMGDAYTGIYYVSIGNEFTDLGSSILACNNLAQMSSFSTCFQISSPWVGMIDSVTENEVLTMYPAFGSLQPNYLDVLLSNFSSDFGESTLLSRDIPVYLPPSIVQNTIHRKVNILIVNDGSLEELSTYIAAGFEVAQNTGVAPESIVIGIPQREYDTCNRNYELSFESCATGWEKYSRWTNDPVQSSAYWGCPGSDLECPAGGGNDAYLTWIYNDVIPAVLADIDMSLNEVSIVGGSMGGLTSCYAPSKFPQWYSRGYCYAPAVMWNFGSINDVIISNFAQTGMLPKSVIMEVGHEAYDVFTDTSTGEVKNFLQLIKSVLDTWRSVGMESLYFEAVTFPPSESNTYSSQVLGGAPSNTVMLYNQRAAFHSTMQWQLSFMTHLGSFYRSSYNDSTRLQRVDYDWYVGQTAVDSSDDDKDDSDKKLIIGLSVALTTVTVALLGLAIFVALHMRGHSTDKKSLMSESRGGGLEVL